MRIFFAEHHTGKFPDGRTALQVKFTDKQCEPYKGNYGNKYIWTPKWSDLELIFLLSYHVERLSAYFGVIRPVVRSKPATVTD